MRRDDACRRVIEATRARVPPPPPQPPRAHVGDDVGDDEREAGVRDDARSSDARARHRRAR